MSKEKRRVPKLRFPGFTEDWEQRKLCQITTRVTRKNGSQSDLPLTISAQDGLVDQRKYFNRQVASRDMSNYYLIKKGEFAYNKSYSEGYPFGAVKRLDYYDIGALSTLYILFEITDNISSDFIVSYYMTHLWYKEISKRAAEGARNHGLLNISTEDFFDSELNIPTSIEEQVKIGNFIKQFDKFITLHQRKLEHLNLKKKALLQKLFPKNGECYPELRFPGFTDAWEQCKLGSLASVEMNKRIFKEQTTTNGDIPFYKIGTFGSDADSFISRELFEEYKNKYPYPNIGDILISASGSIGRTVVYNGEDAYFQDSNIVWLNHNGKIDNSFLLQFYNQVKWAGLEGSTIKRLYNKNILETNIALPKIEEQRLIGKFFTLVDSTITLHQRKLDHLQLQKKALLQQMFV